MVGGKNKKKLALHQSFQERGLRSDVQMLKSTPIQVPDVTPSAKLITRQVAQIHLFPLVINRLCTQGISGPGNLSCWGGRFATIWGGRGWMIRTGCLDIIMNFRNQFTERKPDLISVVLPALKYLLKHEFLLHKLCFLWFCFMIFLTFHGPLPMIGFFYCGRP